MDWISLLTELAKQGPMVLLLGFIARLIWRAYREKDELLQAALRDRIEAESGRTREVLAAIHESAEAQRTLTDLLRTSLSRQAAPNRTPR